MFTRRSRRGRGRQWYVISDLVDVFAHTLGFARRCIAMDGAQEGREKGGTPLILADQNVAARCVAMGPPRPMLA